MARGDPGKNSPDARPIFVHVCLIGIGFRRSVALSGGLHRESASPVGIIRGSAVFMMHLRTTTHELATQELSPPTELSSLPQLLPPITGPIPVSRTLLGSFFEADPGRRQLLGP